MDINSKVVRTPFFCLPAVEQTINVTEGRMSSLELHSGEEGELRGHERYPTLVFVRNAHSNAVQHLVTYNQRESHELLT